MATLAAREAARVLGIPSSMAEAAWGQGVTPVTSHALRNDVVVYSGPHI